MILDDHELPKNPQPQNTILAVISGTGYVILGILALYGLIRLLNYIYIHQ